MDKKIEERIEKQKKADLVLFREEHRGRPRRNIDAQRMIESKCLFKEGENPEGNFDKMLSSQSKAPRPKTHLYFVGIRQETTRFSSKLFDGEIVLKTPNHPRVGVTYFKKYYGFDVDCNDLKLFGKICEFYAIAMKNIVERDPEAKFMFYNQMCLIYPKISEFNLVYINNPMLVEQLNNKVIARHFAQKFMNVLEYREDCYKYEITPKVLDTRLSRPYERYVAQEPVGFAGQNTFIMDHKNYTRVRLNLKEHQAYSVSGYVENNTPVNVHFMIGDDAFIIFDGSVQKISVDIRLKYNGWDFDAFEKLDKDIQENIFEQMRKVLPELQKLKYRGVGGIDFIINPEDKKAYFMEFNPRFQTSSEGLDEILQKKGFPGIFELNKLCFEDPQTFEKLAKRISN